MDSASELYEKIVKNPLAKLFLRYPSSRRDQQHTEYLERTKNPVFLIDLRKKIEDGGYEAGKSKTRRKSTSSFLEQEGFLADLQKMLNSFKEFYKKRDKQLYEKIIEFEVFITSLTNKDMEIDDSSVETPANNATNVRATRSRDSTPKKKITKVDNLPEDGDDEEEEEDESVDQDMDVVADDDENDSQEDGDEDAEFYKAPKKRNSKGKKPKRNELELRIEELESLSHGGNDLQVGDFVLVVANPLQPNLGNVVGCIKNIWVVNGNIRGITLNMFVSARHVNYPGNKEIDPQHVFMSGLFRNFYVEEIVEGTRCTVIPVSVYARKGIPEGFEPNQVFYCKSFLDHIRNKIVDGSDYFDEFLPKSQSLTFPKNPNLPARVPSILPYQVNGPNATDSEDRSGSRRRNPAVVLTCTFNKSCSAQFDSVKQLLSHYTRHLPNQPYQKITVAPPLTPTPNKQISSLSNPPNVSSSARVMMMPNNAISNSVLQGKLPISGRVAIPSTKVAGGRGGVANRLLISEPVMTPVDYPIRFSKELAVPKFKNQPGTNTPELPSDLFEYYQRSSDGQILWFSAPPVFVDKARAMDEPLHSLEYYLFKGKKGSSGGKNDEPPISVSASSTSATTFPSNSTIEEGDKTDIVIPVILDLAAKIINH